MRRCLVSVIVMLGVGTTVAMFSTPLLADTITVTETNWEYEVCSGSVPCTTTRQSGVTFDAQSYGAATVLLDPIPSVRAYVTGDDSAFAGATLQYFIEVVGPGSGVVPLDVLASAAVAASYDEFDGTDSEAGASVSVDGHELFSIFQAGGGGLSYVFFDTMPVQMFTEIEVLMNVFAGGAPTNPASGFADPFFSVNPLFPNADQYSIITSPGIYNVPAPVPLPGTLPLFASGLAGLGWLSRRRRKQTHVA